MIILKKDFAAKRINDKETIEIIKNFSKDYNFILDPHTATAVGASKVIKDSSEILILGTAHPYKFLETIKMATSQELDTPKQVAHLMNKKENYDILENKITDIKKYILGKLSMKIKPGEKLPQNDFYLDEKNEVKKISTNDLFKKKKYNFRYAWGIYTKRAPQIHLPGYIKNYDLAFKRSYKNCMYRS